MKNGRLILKILCVACLFQVILTAYMVVKIYFSSVVRPDQVESNYKDDNYDITESPDFKFELLVEDKNLKGDKNIVSSDHLVRDVLSKTDVSPVVEVWGKAAIASYLWEHIFDGRKIVDSSNPSIYTDQIQTENCILRYKEGPGLQPETVSYDAKGIVIVLNGRTPEKIRESRKWLDSLSKDKKILLVMLGNEKCENLWIQEYISPRGPIVAVFLTYDDTVIDSETYFQWPLGVATYRNFPNLKESEVNLSEPRKYLCNLQATNYANSSRSGLFQQVALNELFHSECFIAERKSWEPSESLESMNEYVKILMQSDLTLCPAGFNTETYRVYEALTVGSVPVIEDTPSSGLCDSSAGWRFLKQYRPPVIWVKNWDDLVSILEKEKRMTTKQKVERRKRLLSWYKWFKSRIKDKFLSIVDMKILKPG